MPGRCAGLRQVKILKALCSLRLKASFCERAVELFFELREQERTQTHYEQGCQGSTAVRPKARPGRLI
jgi:hypothetical protein